LAAFVQNVVFKFFVYGPGFSFARPGRAGPKYHK